MDLTFSEQQEMLKKSARSFLAEKCSKSFVREMERDANGYSPQLWKEIADLSWLGLILPEKYSGAEMNFLDLAILLEEMGRACFPGPFISTVICGGLSILNMGSNEQKQKYLPLIANGKAIFTMAILEADGSTYTADSVQVMAKYDKDGYVINGTKLFVPYAHIADYILCIARTKKSKKSENGITLFIVDTSSPGISTTVLQTIAHDKQCEVVFSEVRVPEGNVLGTVNEGWAEVQRIIEQAALAKACEMVGGMQAALDMTLQYVNQRIQFGAHIGSFQAIQWHCVNMAMDVDSSRMITYEAAWRLSEGLSYSVEAAMAKAWVSEAYGRVVASGIQAHGGVSIIEDHDMPLYFKRAKADEIIYGDSRFHRKTIAKKLGLEKL